MAYDAGMAKAVCYELSQTAVGAKIEKIYQPSDDEIVLLCRRHGEKPAGCSFPHRRPARVSA